MENINKKKIAIVTQQMVMGGIEKSLIELCKTLINYKYDVTLYLVALGGELFDKIPDGIKISYLFENYSSMFKVFKYAIKKKEWKKFRLAVKSYIINCSNGDPIKGWKYTAEIIKNGTESYDYMFAYAAPVSFSVVFVNQFLRAKKKYVWIHNDPSQLSLDIQKYKELFFPYDKILCVSKKTRSVFDSLLPEFRNKTDVFYNIIDREEIIRQSKMKIKNELYSGIKILTVGRLNYEKGQDIIPNVVRLLVRDKLDFKWYCVGEGESRKILEDAIDKFHLEDHLILLGNQDNPYPYFNLADIYVQTSRNEGFGITIAEAKIFKLPIVTTNFSCVEEQIVPNKTGTIVSFDVWAMYRAVKKMIEDNDYRMSLRNNLKQDPLNCSSELEQLFR